MHPAKRDMLTAKIGQAIDARIAPLFRGQPKITVLVRLPDNDEADVLVTSDDDAGIRAIVERRTNQKGQEARE